MNKEEIMQLEGRELDAFVSERVFGIDATWRHWFEGSQRHYDFMDANLVIIPAYSTDISAAWEVVEKLKIAVIPQSIGAPNDMKYLARIEEDVNQEEIQIFASTAPEAICRAALLAVMEVES